MNCQCGVALAAVHLDVDVLVAHMRIGYGSLNGVERNTCGTGVTGAVGGQCVYTRGNSFGEFCRFCNVVNL